MLILEFPYPELQYPTFIEKFMNYSAHQLNKWKYIFVLFKIAILDWKMEELKHAFWTNYSFRHNVALNLLHYDNSFLGPYHISVYNTEEEEIEYANYDEKNE